MVISLSVLNALIKTLLPTYTLFVFECWISRDNNLKFPYCNMIHTHIEFGFLFDTLTFSSHFSSFFGFTAFESIANFLTSWVPLVLIGSGERCESVRVSVLCVCVCECGASGRRWVDGRCGTVTALCARHVLICCWWIAGSDVASIKPSFLCVYVLKAAALQGDTLGSIRVKLLFVSF